jgi:hypothetical protein
MELWVRCVAGALSDRDYRQKLAAAGCEAIDIVHTLGNADYLRLADNPSVGPSMTATGLLGSQPFSLDKILSSRFISEPRGPKRFAR